MFPRLLLIALTFALGVQAFAAEIIGTPKITAVASTSAVVSWKTDVETGTRVSYGPAPDQLTERAEGGVTAAHEVTLTGLKSGAKYFYAVGTARKKLATGEFTTSGSAATVASPPSSSPSTQPPTTPRPQSALAKLFAPKPDAPPTRETWGNMASLADHFERHGADFRAKDAGEYARMAWELHERSKRGGLLVKVDDDGTHRVFDPKTGAFGAYNRDGTTKTFFKPNSRDYFARQPGRSMNVPRR
jgi:pyocin large subunit-like protein